MKYSLPAFSQIHTSRSSDSWSLSWRTLVLLRVYSRQAGRQFCSVDPRNMLVMPTLMQAASASLVRAVHSTLPAISAQGPSDAGISF